MKYNDPKIEVFLNPDKDEEIPQHSKYIGIVMDYNKGWYNTGIVRRGHSPE